MAIKEGDSKLQISFISASDDAPAFSPGSGRIPDLVCRRRRAVDRGRAAGTCCHLDRSVDARVGGHARGIVLLQRALAIDPAYTPAVAMFGWCRMFQRWQNWGLVSDDEVAEGLRLARRAIEAGKDDPEALWMAALTLLSLAGERPTAASAVERAPALNPHSAHAWMARDWVSCFAGQPSSAIEAFEHAMRLSPLDPLGWGFRKPVVSQPRFAAGQ